MINHKSTISIIILILFIQISSQNLDVDKLLKDINIWLEHKDTTSCPSVKLNSGYYQCCKVSSLTAGNSVSFCSAQITPISEFKKMMEMSSIKAIIKESFGITKYRYVEPLGINPDSIRTSMTYDCPDGKVTTQFGYDTYTEEEIDILKSDEHCLDYLYNYRTFSSKQECYDSLLLPSSINLGLTCGYYKYSIKYSDGSNYEIESCGIFNKDLLGQKNLDQQSKDGFKSFVSTNKEDGKVVLSYEVSLSNKEGQYLVYDSSIDGIISSSYSSNSSGNLILNYLLYILLSLLI